MQLLAPLVEKVTALAARFTTAGLPHAFGGALALAAHTGPRPVARIQLHFFVEPREAEPVLARLAVLGVAMERGEVLERIAIRRRVELGWGATPVVLDFGTDGLHELARPRVRRVPFDSRWIYVLSAEDLVLASALSEASDAREELGELLTAAGLELDLDYLRQGLRQLGPAHPPAALERLLATRGH